MAVPFGVSIGDFIAVGSLTHQIITALSDSRGSKAEYKDLISLLSSLKWALQAVSGQFFELASSEGVDAAFGNGLKHQLGLCTKTMEDFLLSSQKYTESLLPDDRKKNFRKEFRKITWCLFKKEDVQQLYSTLQGHIQAFIMLMNAVTGVCLFQTKQLALESHTATARIERQLTEKFALLMSVMTRPPRSLGYTWEGGLGPGEGPICFEDALGRSFSIPLVLCRTMNVFHDVLKILFQDLPGQKQVTQGEYEMMDESSEGSIIQETDWKMKILPGGRIAMNILLRVSSTSPTADDIHICPRCNTSNHHIKPIRSIIHCLHCQLAFRVTNQERIVELLDTPPGEEGSSLAQEIVAESLEESRVVDDAFRRVHYLREVNISTVVATSSVSLTPDSFTKAEDSAEGDAKLEAKTEVTFSDADLSNASARFYDLPPETPYDIGSPPGGSISFYSASSTPAYTDGGVSSVKSSPFYSASSTPVYIGARMSSPRSSPYYSARSSPAFTGPGMSSARSSPYYSGSSTSAYTGPGMSSARSTPFYSARSSPASTDFGISSARLGPPPNAPPDGSVPFYLELGSLVFKDARKSLGRSTPYYPAARPSVIAEALEAVLSKVSNL